MSEELGRNHGQHQLWQQLVTAALVGGDRQPLSLEARDDTPLGRSLAQLDATDPSVYLLQAAAVVSLYRQSGWQAATCDPAMLPSPPQPDEVPPCPPSAGEALSVILAQGSDRLLGEWLDALVSANQRVREANLPDLLEFGKKKPELWDVIRWAIARHGGWLAAQNPDWAYAATLDVPTDEAWRDRWQEADLLTRKRLLAHLRRREPDAGLSAIAATWEQNSATDKVALLEALSLGLNPGDEPFLESVLDDRSKQVRSAAADLLARLPDSLLCQRMTARVRSLLTIETSGTITVTLPAACDGAMARDGVDPKPPSGKGQKAWWLQQMLAAVPPGIWSEMASPGDLIEAALEGQYPAALLGGWAVATIRHQDKTWAEALLLARAVSKTRLREVTKYQEALMAVLPLAQREAMVWQLLQEYTEPLSLDHPALVLLRLGQQVWSPDLSQAVLERIGAYLQEVAIAPRKRDTNSQDWDLSLAIKDLGSRLSPKIAETAAVALSDAIGQLSKHWQTALTEFLQQLQFRQEMLAAFSPFK